MLHYLLIYILYCSGILLILYLLKKKSDSRDFVSLNSIKRTVVHKIVFFSNCVQITTLTSDYTPVSKDPRYAKYFKMVQVGIPPAALHAKMRMEGLDPIYLDNPDQPAPPNSEEVVDETDSDGSYDSD